MSPKYREILQAIGAMGKAYIDDMRAVLNMPHRELASYLRKMDLEEHIRYGYDGSLYCVLTEFGVEDYEKATDTLLANERGNLAENPRALPKLRPISRYV